MTLEECRQEKEQLDAIRGIQVSKIGFVCTGGFAFKNEKSYILVDGTKLYSPA